MTTETKIISAEQEQSEDKMSKSIFKIEKMDCSAEEELVRMKLNEIKEINQLQFDLSNRTLEVYHYGELDSIEKAIDELRLNSKLIVSNEVEDMTLVESQHIERKLLILVLIINASFFLLEIITGFLANSMGLVADSLDMLADAIVYGLSLYAVGSLIETKKKIAHASGYFQMTLAVLGFVEVIRRFLGVGDVPAFQTMIIISLLALVGNSISLYILQRSKSKEAHIQASMIFTSNDVIANIGVIAAGIIVYFTGSKIPDLTIGSIVFLLVGRGALRILKM